ncbi:hypothetical protein LZ31DRAFT_284527 [Colletotrichum somersetense]|nr:hypothetical protein LZ31DRAFT_284527 [Colletotrichum somersetense]
MQPAREAVRARGSHWGTCGAFGCDIIGCLRIGLVRAPESIRPNTAWVFLPWLEGQRQDLAAGHLAPAIGLWPK